MKKKTNHANRTPTIENIKENYYCYNIAKEADKFIKLCEEFLKNDYKENVKGILIKPAYSIKIFAADLLFLDQQTVVLTAIDYYNRKAEVRNIIFKRPKKIQNALKNIFKSIGKSKTLVTDNKKEFMTKEIKKQLEQENIDHHTTSVEKHKANRRIERFHRTMWQGFRKK